MMMDSNSLEEFEREIAFMQRCRHPQLVRFFGAGYYPAGTISANKNTPFLVLELVDRGSLKSYIHKNPNIPYGIKHQIAWDVAEGIGFIHSLDSLHRDVKSGNVLITSALRAKVSDFGSVSASLLRNAQQRPSELGGLDASGMLTAGVGTPLYMATEVLQGGDYGPAADVFRYVKSSDMGSPAASPCQLPLFIEICLIAWVSYCGSLPNRDRLTSLKSFIPTRRSADRC
eukprot:m.75240 g.75240  ORF g.75240 m.75240 type:complete len:229 (+) comp14397_c1_seq15:176-862(+)